MRFKLPRLPRVQFRRPQLSRRGQKLLASLAWGYLGLTLLYAALLWLGGDSWWVATLLLFFARWPALVPAPLLALVLLPLRPRLLLPVALAVLVTLGPAMGFRLGWRRWFTPATTPDLRLVTFNVNSSQNARVLGLSLGLESYHPDIVVLQECTGEMVHAQFWPANWVTRFDQGICLATRFPVLETRTLARIETGDQGGTGSAMFYRIRLDVGRLDLGVIHLETPRKGLEQLRYRGRVSAVALNVMVRDVGSRRLSKWFKEQSDSMIIAGDFNMPVESTIYRAYWSDCVNAFSQVGRGFGWTRVLPHFAIRIDHVLACNGWRPLRAVVGPDLGSDHLPLVVELARKR